jgi:hypothetical protein
MLIPMLVACSTRNRPEKLQGSWKVDSVYTYYNGFGFTRNDVEKDPFYHYLPGGKAFMTLELDSQYIQYEFPHPDTLVLRSAAGRTFTTGYIEMLDRDRLVLRIIKNPLFKGGHQERYEIRYFSKLNK